jgi:hypothetical protein
MARMIGMLLAVACWGSAAAGQERMSYLDNGRVRLGVNLDLGGSSTYISAGDGKENVVNNHDWGRQVQMSFYSGPVPFAPGGKQPAKAWSRLGWNPIQSGDYFGHRAKVLEHRNDGNTIYVKCVPMQWPLNDEPGECTFEVWIELQANAAHVRSRLNNARSDKTFYEARGQELPAVYTNSAYWRLMTYTGDKPFTGDKLVRIDRKLEEGGWAHASPSENWAALVNDDEWGLGVYSPGNYRFSGGFHGTPKGPGTDPTGYISPVCREIIDATIVYEYRYVLVLGPLKDIRQWVYDNAPRPAAPQWTFLKDRQHWYYVNASDQGWPIRGELNVSLEKDDPQLISPDFFCPAELAPRLRIEAAFRTAQKSAQVFWKTSDHPFSGDLSTSFAIEGDGNFRVYEVKLAGHPRYKGVITGLRIDPAGSAEKGASVRVKSVSLTK